jgi:hypothetical protein
MPLLSSPVDSNRYFSKVFNFAVTDCDQDTNHNIRNTKFSKLHLLNLPEYGRRDPSRCPCGTLYLQKLALSSPTSGGCSVGIVCSWTEAMEFLTSIEQWQDSKEMRVQSTPKMSCMLNIAQITYVSNIIINIATDL